MCSVTQYKVHVINKTRLILLYHLYRLLHCGKLYAYDIVCLIVSWHKRIFFY